MIHGDYEDPIDEQLARADESFIKLKAEYEDDDGALYSIYAAYGNLIERIYSSTLPPGYDLEGYLLRAALRGLLYRT